MSDHDNHVPLQAKPEPAQAPLVLWVVQHPTGERQLFMTEQHARDWRDSRYPAARLIRLVEDTEWKR